MTNPFPGLRPFHEEEEYLFFGRERQVDALVDKLAATRLLAVVGTSGSGKSSLVNCGLRPALHRGLMTSAGSSWRMAQFRPGSDPLGAMARALSADGLLYSSFDSDIPLVEIIDTTLRMSKRGLLDVFLRARPHEHLNLLVVVDQFEELFRYQALSDSQHDVAYGVTEEATAFVNLLLEVRKQTDLPVYVVLTMRSDFLGDCAQFQGLPEAINAGQFLVPRMTRTERRAAIAGPAGVGGATIAPILLTRLVNDVGDNPDQLSILQHALNRTWAQWEDEGTTGPLDLPHYEAIGTMAQALDQHAEQAYGALDTERKRDVCEKLFKALTDKGTDPRGIRRPTKLGTLCSLTAVSQEEVVEVIDVFRDPSRSFLMPPIKEEVTAETVIDISHESLMRVWVRLNRWADEEAQSASTYRRLRETAALHAADRASLWRGPDLELALGWRNEKRPTAEWARQYGGGYDSAMEFLDASEAAWKADLERQRNRRRRVRMIAASIIIVLTISSVVSFWSLIRATEQQELANHNLARVFEEKAGGALRNAVDGKTGLERHYREAWLYTLWALLQNTGSQRLPVSLGRLMLPELHDRALLADTSYVHEHQSIVNSVAFSPDGRRLASASSDSTVHVWRVEGGTEVDTLLGHAGDIWSVAFNPTGETIASASSDGTVRLWTPRGDTLRTLSGPVVDVWSVAFNPDGSTLASGSSDNTIRLWDVERGELTQTLTGHRADVRSVAFSPDGRLLASASSDSTIRIWDLVVSRDAPHALVGHNGDVWSVTFSPDGRLLASASSDSTIRVWDLERRDTLQTLRGHQGDVWSVAFSPDGRHVVSGSEDRHTMLWGVGGAGSPLAVVGGHEAGVLSVGFSPEGDALASGGADRVARVVDFIVRTQASDEAVNLWELLDEPSSDGNMRRIRRLFDRSLARLNYRKDEEGLGLVNLNAPVFADIAFGDDSIPTVPFDTAYWAFHQSGNLASPNLSDDDSVLVLVPGGLRGVSRVAFYREAVLPPFTIDFDYWISREGDENLVFIFLKNRNAYPSPLTDTANVFIRDGTGYSVHFSMHGEQRIELRDPAAARLASYRFDRRKKALLANFERGTWIRVRVTVTDAGVTVNYGGTQVIDWNGTLSASLFHDIGFAAFGSDSSDAAEHRVRNVRLVATTPTRFQLASWYERMAFNYLLGARWDSAQVAFQNAEDVYPTFHQVYEIARLLRQQQGRIVTEEDRRALYRRILEEFSWRAPPELLERLRELSVRR